MVVSQQKSSNGLIQSRNRTVAKSFYRQLRDQGFSHEQILQLSTTLIDMVTEDMRPGTN